MCVEAPRSPLAMKKVNVICKATMEGECYFVGSFETVMLKESMQNEKYPLKTLLGVFSYEQKFQIAFCIKRKC